MPVPEPISAIVQPGVIPAVSARNGNTAAGKTKNGDMYAAHDGNVYKNTGSGWSKYDNGDWNPVQKPDTGNNSSNDNLGSSSANRESANQQQRSEAAQRSSGSGSTSRGSGQGFGGSASSGAKDVDRDFQNRQRGEAQSRRFGESRWGGGERSGGGGERRRR